MDPNVALENARAAKDAYFAADRRVWEELAAAADLAEAFDAIDNWLAMGGFLPDEWNRGLVPVHQLETEG